MAQVTKNEDTTVKLSKKALKQLESKAKPFESKKECLERIITQNCCSSKETPETEPEKQTEESQESENSE